MESNYAEERICNAILIDSFGDDILPEIAKIRYPFENEKCKQVMIAYNQCIENVPGSKPSLAQLSAVFVSKGISEIAIFKYIIDTEQFSTWIMQDVKQAVDNHNLCGDKREDAKTLKQCADGEIQRHEMIAEMGSREKATGSFIESPESAIDTMKENWALGSIDTGFPTVDYSHGGLKRKRVSIIAALTGCGKTDISLHITKENLKQKKNVAFVSIEMDSGELAERIGRSLATNPKDKKEVEQCFADLCNSGGRLDIITDQFTDLSPSTIASLIAKDIDLVVVDYLQIIDSERDSSYEQVTDISKKMRAIAKRTTAAWLILSQFNRDAAKGKNPEPPQLHNLRGSGAIEQDAHFVAVLHQPNGEADYGMDQDVEFKILKNRGGAKGIVSLTWTRESSQWREL